MPNLIAGLSNITKNFSTGNTELYKNNSIYLNNAQTVEQEYNSYVTKNAGIQFISFPPDLPDYKIVLVARDYPLFGGSLNRGDSRGIHGYVLPLPQMKLIDRYEISYDDNAQLLSMLRFRGSASVISDILNKVEQVGKFAGLNINKFKTVLMESPILKRHQFVWKLSPKNIAESNIIRTIVNRLKFDMAPNLTARAVFTYPYIFDIYYSPNAEWMYPFKPSVIESLDVDYNSDSPHPALYKQIGAPESITLSMSLIEIEVWVKGDYNKWNTTIGTPSFNPVDTVRSFTNSSPQQDDNTVSPDTIFNSGA